MKTIKILFVALACVIPMAACGGSPAEGETTVSPQYEGPVQSQDVAGGEQLFTDVCGACHIDGGAPDLNEHAHSVAMIRQTVREGDGQMPPLDVSRLSDEDLEAILAYMVSVHSAE